MDLYQNLAGCSRSALGMSYPDVKSALTRAEKLKNMTARNVQMEVVRTGTDASVATAYAYFALHRHPPEDKDISDEFWVCMEQPFPCCESE